MCVCLWLCWAFIAAQAFSRCGDRGLLFVVLHRLLIAVASLLQSTGSRAPASVVAVLGSVVVVHGLRCPVACGIFPDQGSNLCPLRCKWILHHWTTREVPEQSLLISNILTFWLRIIVASQNNYIILYTVGCLEVMFRSIYGLPLLNASSIPHPICANPKYPKTLPHVLGRGGHIAPSWGQLG